MRKKNLFLRMVATLLLPLVLLTPLSLPTFAESESRDANGGKYAVEPVKDALNLNCKSAFLMEACTGTVLYEQNPDEALPPASVTKIMTLLLVMEALDSGKIKLEDKVSASERAASMGGSQIYLKVGEEMSVEELLKSVIIASANDAACALAEYVAGSEAAFVKAMNDRAAELGMKNTVFENTNGLDDTAQNHLTTARDIALMSAELIKHEKILEYSSIWMDSVRNGTFGLTNTNRLVRFYRGCTGLKTGSTSKAGFCISATAERNGMHLIAVIMGAETRDIRNAEAQKLLDWGFAEYETYTHTPESLEDVRVTGGVSDSLPAVYEGVSAVLKKGQGKGVKCEIILPESVSAPVKKGDPVGEAILTLNGREIGRSPICAAADVEAIGFLEILWRMLGKFLMK